MEKFYSLAIPEPCHEDWNSMTPNEKGKFCNSCSKTVIDFTNMTVEEIQEYIHENKEHRICGHIRQNQLDLINLRIPEHIFLKRLNIHKVFLLALLLTMGTSLLSCTNRDGKIQKINSIEVVSNSYNSVLNTKDSIEKDTENTVLSKIKGAIENDSIKTEDIIEIEGEVIVDVVGIMTVDAYETLLPLHSSIAYNPPEFKDMPLGLSIEEKRDYLSDKIGDFVRNNFNLEITKNLDLKGIQRIYINFTIDTLGNVNNIRVRAPHFDIERKTKEIIKLLPQFIPAKQDGKNVAVSFNLPVIFNADN